jgi:hypothetical protein
LEEERQKQRLAEADKGREEETEQERIEKLKRQELERQRRLNISQDKPPRRRRTPNSSNDHQGSMNKSQDSVRSKKTKSTKDTDSTSINIVQGRHHPCVETSTIHTTEFIPNDLCLGRASIEDSSRLLLLSGGPNIMVRIIGRLEYGTRSAHRFLISHNKPL